MKRVILLRHAKSDWENLRQPDHDRTLNKRGARDAPYMAKWLAEKIDPPHTIMVSTAVRASETAVHFIAAFSIEEDNVMRLREIYEAGLDDLVGLIKWQSPAEADCVMVVGHNPTMTMALEWLSDSRIDNMPTCCVAVIEFPNAESWEDIAAGELKILETPKTLAAKG